MPVAGSGRSTPQRRGGRRAVAERPRGRAPWSIRAGATDQGESVTVSVLRPDPSLKIELCRVCILGTSGRMQNSKAIPSRLHASALEALEEVLGGRTARTEAYMYTAARVLAPR